MNLHQFFFAVFLTFSVILSFDNSAFAGILHTVLAFDINDPLVEDAVQTCRLKPFLENNISANELKIHRISANQMTEDGIRNVIRGLPLQADDAVLFYYIGHGRFDNNLQATCLMLSIDPNAILSWSDVTAEIRNRGCRLTAVVFDCCNRDDRNLGRARAVGAGIPKGPPTTKPLCKKLFFETSGSIFVCSSSPGEYALVKAFDRNDQTNRLPVGPIFTSAFTKTLEEESTKSLSWKSITSKTQSLVDIYFDELTDGRGQFTLGGQIETQSRQTIRMVQNQP